MTQEMMTADILDRIHDEAVQLLKLDALPDDAKRGLDRIVALARYQFPVLSQESNGGNASEA